MSKQQTGHVTLTYRVRLYDRHFAWLKATGELYVQVVKHFFEVLSKEEDLSAITRVTSKRKNHHL